MLSNEQIEQNKNTFLNLISTINIPGADIQGLTNYLTTNGFFTAPASTLYHCNYAGGLCEHSLHVYNELVRLANIYFPNRYDMNSLLVVGLLHDISKTDFYELYVANKKVYDERGTKHDNMGKFEWVGVEGYKVRDANNRFLAGNHGFNSVMLLGNFIPMTLEESSAVYNHMYGSDDKYMNPDLSAIANKYPLVTLLHAADFLSTFALERTTNE